MGCLAEKTRQATQQTTEKERVEERICRESDKKDDVALNPQETVEVVRIAINPKQQNQPDLSHHETQKNSAIIMTPPTTATVTVSDFTISQKPRKQGWVKAQLYPYEHLPRPIQQVRLSPRPAWTISDKYVDQDFRKTGKVLNLNHQKIRIEQLLLRRQKSSK